MTTRLAYVLAASHSGSTLLAMLLGTHPEVCTTGELKATSLGDVEKYRCSCGSLIRECDFWRRIGEDMRQRGFTFDITDSGTDLRSRATRYEEFLLRPLCRGRELELCRDAALSLSSGWRRRLGEFHARNTALAQCICARSGARVVVDSSKVGLRLKYLLRNPELDVRVIRLIRDGRAVSLTYTDPARFADAATPELRGGGDGSSRHGERRTMRQAAWEWRRSNEEADAIVARLPRSQWVEVKYEDVCEAPREALRRVFTTLGVAPDWSVASFRSVEQHVLGNGMRLDSTSEVRLDDRWRFALSEGDLRVFAQVGGQLNGRLGYR